MEEMFIFNSPAYFDVQMQIGQVRLRAQCKINVENVLKLTSWSIDYVPVFKKRESILGLESAEVF